jgi:hypothetical protein
MLSSPLTSRRVRVLWVVDPWGGTEMAAPIHAVAVLKGIRKLSCPGYSTPKKPVRAWT